jgi:hypothetical protein
MLGPGAGPIERLGPPVGPLAGEVLRALEGGEDTCEAIAAALDLGAGAAAATLADLEADGYVTCSTLGVYVRTLLRPAGPH